MINYIYYESVQRDIQSVSTFVMIDVVMEKLVAKEMSPVAMATKYN